MFPEIPLVPLIIAFAANFVVGGIWYGVFSKPWMREVGLDEATIKGGNWPMPAYVVAVVGAAVQAFVFTLIVLWARPTGAGQTLLIGALVGALAAFATGKHHAFSRKTWTLFAIDGGNDVFGFLAMSVVYALA